jgi:hypothetical protein
VAGKRSSGSESDGESDAQGKKRKGSRGVLSPASAKVVVIGGARRSDDDNERDSGGVWNKQSNRRRPRSSKRTPTDSHPDAGDQ